MRNPADKIHDDWKDGGRFRQLMDEARRDRTLVFTNGCFDVLHVGHIILLNKAKNFSWAKRPYLIVGLNHDASVRRLKGTRRPIFPFYARAYQLASLAAVDMVVGFQEETPEPVIGVVNPHVLVKGGEYEGNSVPGDKFVRAKGGVVIFIPTVDGVSTTHIISQRVDMPEFDYKEL